MVRGRGYKPHSWSRVSRYCYVALQQRTDVSVIVMVAGFKPQPSLKRALTAFFRLSSLFAPSLH